MADTYSGAEGIGISAWCYNKEFFAHEITFPLFFKAAKEAEVSLVEINSPFFESQEPGHIEQIRRSAEETGIRIVNISVDDWDYNLSGSELQNRAEAVARTIKWLDIAKSLGCKYIRNNTGGEDFDACVDSFTTLSDEARQRGLKIVIEVHGGFSAKPETLLPLLQKVQERQPDGIALVPDWGNLREYENHDHYSQFAELVPHADVVHAKMRAFDENGDQPSYDIPRLIGILRDADFEGPYVIEYESDSEPAESAVKKSVALLRRLLTM